MDQKSLIGIEMAREEDMLLAGLRRYWGVTQLPEHPSEAELSASQSSSMLRTPEEQVIRTYGAYFLPAFSAMHEEIERGMHRLAQWHAPALFLTPEHLCLLTFKAMLPTSYPSWVGHKVHSSTQNLSLQDVAMEISNQAWQLMHYLKAREEFSEIWEYRSRLIKNWSPKKQRRFVKEVHGMHNLPREAKLAFGVAMVQCIVSAVTEADIEEGNYFARIEKKRVSPTKTISLIHVNPSIVKDMETNHELRQWLRPKWGPMVCRPNDWTRDENENWVGGYLMPGMQMRFVRPATPGHSRYGVTEPGQPAVDAINKLQNTPYTVNTQILDVLRLVFQNSLGLGDCPVSAQNEFDFTEYEGDQKDSEGKYTEEFKAHLAAREKAHGDWAKAWADRMRMVMRLDMAQDIVKYPAYWLPVTMDFRGRCYTSTEMLSPQGSDFDKALCCFAEAKPYTEAGRRWMKIQIANLFGEDKISFDDRVAWFDENEAAIKAIADDPIANSWWSVDGDDKKKWQLLASILDYYRDDGLNQVAVQMDGSCNGIQHWSAIGRDKIGARATNLLPGDKPCDLYTEVADAANRILQEENDNDWHIAWRDHGVSRKCAKRPCMTYPYGVTLRGCVDSLKADGFCDWAGDGKAYAAQYIGNLLMERAIPDVVSASYQYMAWAKEMARQVNAVGTHLEWVTPTGTLVRHNYFEEKLVRLDVCGKRVNIQTVAEENAKLNPSEQVSGVAPNFVHSLDASHMLLTINAMWEEGLCNYSMIHDSYGCHACDVDSMQRHIREQFVWMYTEHQPAQELAAMTAERTQQDLVPPPSGGTLDINTVLEAPYFFA